MTADRDNTDDRDTELWGYMGPLGSDGDDPGGVGEEVGGEGALAATWAQLCVIFTCSLALFFIISNKVWFWVSSFAILVSLCCAT